VSIAACIPTGGRLESLLRAIESVQPHVDGIFVLDTGSTDGTVERLDAMRGVTVARIEWRDDFADAYRRSFEMAVPDFGWLLSMHDDETIAGPGHLPDLLAQVPAETDVLRILRKEKHHPRDPYQAYSHEIRLVRPERGWGWRGVVDVRLEAPAGREDAVGAIDPAQLLLHHHPDIANRDPDRNLRILRAAVEADKLAGCQSDSRTLYYLAVELATAWVRRRDEDDNRRALLREIERSLRGVLAGPEPARSPLSPVLPLHPLVFDALPGYHRGLFRRTAAKGLA
jgi:glycosyltransferase involved in cell wall biosynthesis